MLTSITRPADYQSADRFLMQTNASGPTDQGPSPVNHQQESLIVGILAFHCDEWTSCLLNNDRAPQYIVVTRRTNFFDDACRQLYPIREIRGARHGSETSAPGYIEMARSTIRTFL